MQKFYFTYGVEGQPFYGGWTEIEAPDEDVAREIFLAIHPSRNGFLPCSSVYTEEQMKKYGMLTNGNFGSFAHEIISYHLT